MTTDCLVMCCHRDLNSPCLESLHASLNRVRFFNSPRCVSRLTILWWKSDFGCGQEWEGCRSKTVAPGSSTEVVITDLNPSSSYIFRLFAVAAGEEEAGPGPEVAFDTEGGFARSFWREGTACDCCWVPEPAECGGWIDIENTTRCANARLGSWPTGAERSTAWCE